MARVWISSRDVGMGLAKGRVGAIKRTSERTMKKACYLVGSRLSSVAAMLVGGP
ncbi:hypothetical protein D9M72_658470 [compost metagenome]